MLHALPMHALSLALHSQPHAPSSLVLQLRPYQRRALAHMLREERFAPTAANPGGSARHMWVKLPLLENPDVHCYVSPILHQIRCAGLRGAERERGSSCECLLQPGPGVQRGQM